MNWKKFTAFTISISLIVCMEQLVHACGGDIDPYDEYPSFFFNNINGAPAYTPFYYTSLLTYYTEGYDYKNDSTQTDPNETEWYNYTGKVASRADIDSFVYSAPLEEVGKLNRQINEGGKETLSNDLQQNTFVKWLVAHKDKEAAAYLLFAKQCEPYTAAPDGHWDSKTQAWMVTPRDSGAMAQLVNTGLSQYKTANKDFIKWRYRYQILRMAMYSGSYTQTLSLYKELVGDSKYDGIMYARCLGLKAGALYKTDKKIEAAYLYTRIFDISDEMKESAYTSYNWALKGGSESVMQLCANAHERAVVDIMDGLDNGDGPGKGGLSLMEKAYQEDPTIAGLNIIMTREINKAEQDYLQTSFETIPSYDPYLTSYEAENKKTMDSAARTYTAYLNKLNDFSQKVAGEHKNSDKAFWYLSSAYIYFMQGTQDKCKKFLDIAQNEKMTNIERDVHDVINALYIVRANGKVTAKTEAELLPSLKWIEKRSATNTRFAKVYKDLLTSVMSSAYLKQGDTVKAIFCLSRISSDSSGSFVADASFMDNSGMLLSNMNIDGMHSVQAFVQKQDKTDFEKWLTDKTAYSFSVLRELEGTEYIREMQFDKAVATLKSVAKKDLDNTVLPDFLISHIEDVQDWNISDSANMYNKLSFATKMAELQQKVNSDPKDGRSAYQYANGLYSMSYYGKAHYAYVYYRSSTDDNAYVASGDRKKMPAYKQEFYNVQLAQKYYLLAYENNASPEMKARCLFLAAKCWQKNCPPSKENEGYNPYSDNNDYYTNSLKNPYFNQLTTGYKNTKFFEEARSTCSYLAAYISKRK